MVTRPRTAYSPGMVIRDTASACLGCSESVVRRPTSFWVVLLRRWYVGCTHIRALLGCALCLCGGCLLLLHSSSCMCANVQESVKVP